MREANYTFRARVAWPRPNGGWRCVQRCGRSVRRASGACLRPRCAFASQTSGAIAQPGCNARGSIAGRCFPRTGAAEDTWAASARARRKLRRSETFCSALAAACAPSPSRLEPSRKSRFTPPECFLCNVSLPGRRVHGALIYDVRALRLPTEPQRVESPRRSCPFDYQPDRGPRRRPYRRPRRCWRTR
jgi:hypothetical protein